MSIFDSSIGTMIIITYENPPEIKVRQIVQGDPFSKCDRLSWRSPHLSLLDHPKV